MTGGFRIDGHFVPKSYDTNNDRKLQATELSIFCRENDLRFDIATRELIPSFDAENLEYQIDLNMYSLEAIRARYPDSKYSVVWNDHYFSVSSTENSEHVLHVYKSKDGSVDIRNYDEEGNFLFYRHYDSTGRLEIYNDGEQEHYVIAENIYSAVSASNSIGMPTTDKNKLVLNVNRITPENVLGIMNNYDDKYGENIFEAIMDEVGLDINIRVKCIKRIKDALIEHCRDRGIYVDDISARFDSELRNQKDKIGFADADYLDVFLDELLRRKEVFGEHDNVAPNGCIDEDFSQGNTGDCWLLASIVALNNTPKGREILNETVKLNSDGSVTVHLKGVNKRYTISREDLNGNIQLATGDLDVRAIEIAINRYFYEERGVNNSLDIEGNFATVAYEILTGKGVSEDDMYENSFLDAVIRGGAFGSRLPYLIQFDDDMIDGFNNSSKVITVSSHDRGERYTCTSPLEEEQRITLYSNHAYAVIGSDENNVFLINPHDSSTTITISRDDFKRFFTCCQQMTL